MYGYFFSPVYIKFPHLSETYIYVAVYINAEFDVHRREVKKKDISLLYILYVSLVKNGHVQFKKHMLQNHT